MATKKIDVLDELKVLLPETNIARVVIGSDCYEMTPLEEGDLEKITQILSKVYETIYNADRKCSGCQKIFKNAVLKDIEECPTCKQPLDDCRKGPVDAILGGGRVPELIEKIFGLKNEEARKITFPQMKHFAGEFWRLNFSDDGLPVETIENFKKLLGMIGVMPQPKSPGAKTEEKPGKENTQD